MRPSSVWVAGVERDLGELELPLPLGRLVPQAREWEVEIGFGKGRYLLRRAAGEPERGFLGVEMARKYYRLLTGRAGRRGLANLVAVNGEALGLLATALPTAFAAALHVYFPDPWPKSRHQRRRLLDPETVDLVLGLLAPGGVLCFATDHLEYGELVVELLSTHPGLAVERRDGPWDDGPRTSYESKYLAEGRPMIRLEATRRSEAGRRGAAALIHPRGRRGVVAAYRVDGGVEEASWAD